MIRQSLLSALSLLVLGALYGVVAERNDWFPAPFLRDAVQAFSSLNTVLGLEGGESDLYGPARHPGEGVTIHDTVRAQQGATFITRYGPDGTDAILVDMEGEQLHRWPVTYSAIWPEASFLSYQAPDHQVIIHGAHLYPDGDVILSFGGGHFPNGGGLVRLDRCGEVLWTLDRNAHHAVDALSDGRILVSSQYWRDKPEQAIGFLAPPFYEDTILFADSQGVVLGEELSLLATLFDSNQLGSLLANQQPDMDRHDPLHANDAEVLTAEMADAFPLFRTGDILVSFRDTNTIAVIDGSTQLVKWTMTGPFLRQHDPDFLPNGNILIYDNRGGRNPEGKSTSRVMEIDPVTQRVTWEYGGTADTPFFSEIRGKQQPLANGNVLTVEPETGRVFEVTRDKQIVWQYINRVGEDQIGVVTQADRHDIDDLQFIGETCPEAGP